MWWQTANVGSPMNKAAASAADLYISHSPCDSYVMLHCTCESLIYLLLRISQDARNLNEGDVIDLGMRHSTPTGQYRYARTSLFSRRLRGTEYFPAQPLHRQYTRRSPALGRQPNHLCPYYILTTEWIRQLHH